MYWPNKQSIDLNLAVANLFVQTHKKFSSKLFNKTTSYLPADILNIQIKKQLLLEILIELEILVLDIVELDLSVQQVKLLHSQILYSLVNRIMQKFIYQIQIRNQTGLANFSSSYSKLFFHEHSSVARSLIIYLVFGADNIENSLFPFCKLKTPCHHVKALFENLIIQISNIIAFNLLESCTSIKKISSLFIGKNLCNPEYRSIREISNFKNNVASYNWINLYINYPQDVYCSKYQIWLFSSKGIISKHIYMNRTSDYNKLSNLQLVSIIYLELQDFLLPRLNNFIILLGKLLIRVVTETAKKSFKRKTNKQLRD